MRRRIACIHFKRLSYLLISFPTYQVSMSSVFSSERMTILLVTTNLTRIVIPRPAVQLALNKVGCLSFSLGIFYGSIDRKHETVSMRRLQSCSWNERIGDPLHKNASEPVSTELIVFLERVEERKECGGKI